MSQNEIDQLMGKYHRMSEEAIRLRQQGNAQSRRHNFSKARDLWNKAKDLKERAEACKREARDIMSTKGQL